MKEHFSVRGGATPGRASTPHPARINVHAISLWPESACTVQRGTLRGGSAGFLRRRLQARVGVHAAFQPLRVRSVDGDHACVLRCPVAADAAGRYPDDVARDSLDGFSVACDEQVALKDVVEFVVRMLVRPGLAP